MSFLMMGPNGMPMQFGPMPQMVQQNPQSGANESVAMRVPPRIHFAMKVIEAMANYAKKSAATAEGYEVAIEVIPGVDLGLDHLAARSAACDALISYFKGDFKPYDWEMPKKDDEQRGGNIINCPFCHGGRTPGTDHPCQLCSGERSLLVFPAAHAPGG